MNHFSLPEPTLLIARGLAGVPAPKEPPAVLVAEGRVAAMGRAALQGGAHQVELHDLWLSPAPIDAHVHLHLQGSPERNLEQSRLAGLAALRDLGRPAKAAAWENRAGFYPLVRWAGVGMAAQGPGGSWLAQGLAGPEQFAREAQNKLEAGFRVLKIFASGLLDFEKPGQVEYPLAVGLEEIGAVVKAAHAANALVSAHVSGNEGVANCIRAGVDSVEHGFFMGQDTLAELARSGISWSPTLAAVEMHAKDPDKRHDPRIRANLAEIARLQSENMRVAESLGVNLVMGSDAGSYGLPHGKALFEEMRAWLGAGLKPETVYRACTVRAARALGWENELGVIKTGALACFLATGHDPVLNPLELEAPVWRSF